MEKEKSNLIGFRTAVTKEKNRINRMLESLEIPEEKIELLDAVVSNVAFMKAKLEEARKQAESEPLVVKYDNGGGQTGIRENPYFKAYESLFKAYMSGINRLFSELPASVVSDERVKLENQKPQTVLDLVRSRHREGA